MEKVKYLFHCILIVYTTVSCSTNKRVTKQLNNLILKDSAMLNTNIGISILNANTNKYLYNHNHNKYFIPASNTKIFTCYAALKYLPDSLPALQYHEEADTIHIQGTGDPTFMVAEFKQQPIAEFLKKQNKNIAIHYNNWQDNEMGYGWSWTDFGSSYAQGRSALPMYYNSVTFSYSSAKNDSLIIHPDLFYNCIDTINGLKVSEAKKVSIERDPFKNLFVLKSNSTGVRNAVIPFITEKSITQSLMSRAFQQKVTIEDKNKLNSTWQWKTLYSQPTDSMLKPMMHRSDNFYAEQTLLMVSHKVLGYMNSGDIISHIKKNDFKDMPQPARWVDGSGLSRYNMFTPQSIVWLLQKMRNEFGHLHLQNLLPTGGQGTLSSLYKNISGSIHAKTGTLSNHAALSGYLTTRRGNTYIFSTLTSGYQGSATPVRKAVEKLLLHIYEKY